MIMGFVLVIVVSGGLLSLGPSLEDARGRSGHRVREAEGPAHEHGRRHRRSRPHVRRRARSQGNYTATAGVIKINYGGDPGHTLVFTDPKLAGFELETSADARRATSS